MDTIVMNDKEELDSWSVIINGAVRVEGGEGGRSYVLSLGQGFGIKPTMKKEQTPNTSQPMKSIIKNSPFQVVN